MDVLGLQIFFVCDWCGCERIEERMSLLGSIGDFRCFDIIEGFEIAAFLYCLVRISVISPSG